MSHGDFSVNDLSIDCLTEILSFLSLKEQLRCGAVCRRWRPIVPICPKGKRHLEVARLPFARGHLFYGNFSNSECVESALKSILPKLSPAVKSISLADCNLSNEQFDLITCSCRNLEKLTLGIPSKFQLNFDLQRFALQLGKFPKLRAFEMTFDQLEHNLGLAQFYVDIEKLITTWPLEELEIHGAKGFHIMAPELKNLTLLCDDWSNGHFLEMCVHAQNLMNLKYSSCGVTDFSAIAFLTNLTELTIDEDLTNLHLSQICENCRYLKVLELKGIGPAPTDFSGLRSLPLVQIKIFTRGFNDSGMSAVADISSLRILSLSGRSVTDFGLLCLVSGCGQQLEELEIGGNSITDLGVTEVLRNCFQLRTIKLSTIRISDVSITTVADCHSLQILHLSSGPLVTSVGLRNLYCDRKLRHIMTPLIIRWTKWPEVSVEHELVAILATVNVTLKVW